ncbi:MULTISPECIES: VWA domain-containing protein [Nostocaceae]|uniref:vWA domain-containing protein n=1 Tax=Nostocaceae TaxID=1162 RepID=UPI001F55871B|nr:MULTISPECIES: VWA domain-containing protein [Nostocaceae]
MSTTIASLTHKLSLSLLLLASLASPSFGQVKVTEIVGNPKVKDDQVTVRIKVKTQEDRPVMGLQDTDFKLIVDSKEVLFKTQDWKSPTESVPPDAWIIVLLDMSGSMDKPDSKGDKKIVGSINAIRQFTKISSERGGNTQIAIVPFGKPGVKCQGFPVNQETLDKFLLASDFKLRNHLDYLSNLTPCASTDLYEPITKAVRFLSNTQDTRFYLPPDSLQPQPRLSIILLSDGYHNAANEEQDFQTLRTLLKKNSNITVHTLGYGLTPEELGKKYQLGKSATRADIGKGAKKVPEEEFVDQKRLAEIAKLTGGIAEFSGDAEAIAQNLQLFLNALLGEYEITYTEPNADRGSQHSVQVAVSSQGGKPVKSAPKSYRIGVFGRSLPLSTRLIMLGSILGMIGIGGALPFYYWGQYLKQEALRD